MDESRINGNGGILNKPYLNIILAALVGMSGATGVQLSMPDARNDAFTGKEALEMELRVLQQVDKKISRHLTSFTAHELALMKNEIMGAIKHLETNLPPQALRERVLGLEEFARQKDPLYKIPTRKWR